MAYDASKSEEQKKEMQKKVIDLAESFKENPQEFAKYLRFSSQFYNYSARNSMLIFSQNEGTRYCNSFKAFKDLGYSVKRGEHGMKILVPTVKTYLHIGDDLIPLSKATAEQKATYKLHQIQSEQKLYFKVGTVFDIAQTNCPKEDYPKYLDFGYSSEQHARICDTMKKFCEEKLNCPVHESNFNSVVLRGYYSIFLTMAQQNAVFNFLLNNSDCKISKTNARLIRDNPDNFKDIFRYSNPNFSESQTIENQPVKDERPHPKAEKKTKNTTDKPSNTKKKCPSEGHLNLQIPYEVLMTVAAILYKETYSIYQHIISEYATTSESVNFIKARYANNKHLEGTIYADDKSLKYIYYYDGEYKITFKNKLSVSINCDTKIKYTISYAEIDTAIRRFIRKFLTLEDIILMLKEAKK